MSRMLRLFVVALVLIAGPLLGQARAVELKVLSAGALRAVLQQLAPEFEKSSGHKLSIEFATAGGVEQKIAADQAIDVAILNKPRLAKPVSPAQNVGRSTAVLAPPQIGSAVKTGRR